MFSFKNMWKPWSGDTGKPPEKNEQLLVTESLMVELEEQCRTIEEKMHEEEQEDNRRRTGVDYSWLVSAPKKTFEISQIERLELEEMFYKVKPAECGQVISLFRDALLNDPALTDLPRIFKACVRQVLDKRPKEETLTEWVTKHTIGLANMKIRPPSRIVPFATEDVENQSEPDCSESTTVQPFSIRSQSLPNYSRNKDPLDLPV